MSTLVCYLLFGLLLVSVARSEDSRSKKCHYSSTTGTHISFFVCVQPKSSTSVEVTWSGTIQSPDRHGTTWKIKKWFLTVTTTPDRVGVVMYKSMGPRVNKSIVKNLKVDTLYYVYVDSVDKHGYYLTSMTDPLSVRTTGRKKVKDVNRVEGGLTTIGDVSESKNVDNLRTTSGATEDESKDSLRATGGESQSDKEESLRNVGEIGWNGGKDKDTLEDNRMEDQRGINGERFNDLNKEKSITNTRGANVFVTNTFMEDQEKTTAQFDRLRTHRERRVISKPDVTDIVDTFGNKDKRRSTEPSTFRSGSTITASTRGSVRASGDLISGGSKEQDVDKKRGKSLWWWLAVSASSGVGLLAVFSCLTLIVNRRKRRSVQCPHIEQELSGAKKSSIDTENKSSNPKIVTTDVDHPCSSGSTTRTCLENGYACSPSRPNPYPENYEMRLKTKQCTCVCSDPSDKMRSNIGAADVSGEYASVSHLLIPDPGRITSVISWGSEFDLLEDRDENLYNNTKKPLQNIRYTDDAVMYGNLDGNVSATTTRSPHHHNQPQTTPTIAASSRCMTLPPTGHFHHTEFNSPMAETAATPVNTPTHYANVSSHITSSQSPHLSHTSCTVDDVPAPLPPRRATLPRPHPATSAPPTDIHRHQSLKHTHQPVEMVSYRPFQESHSPPVRSDMRHHQLQQRLLALIGKQQ